MKPDMPMLAGAALAVALLSGCGPGGGEAPLPEEVATSLETALTRNEPESCGRLFTADAQIVPEDEPVVDGIEAIIAFCREVAAPELAFDTHRTLSLRRGDLAIEQGTYSIRNVRQGVDVEQGQYLTVWKRSGDSWQIYRSFFNTEQAPRTANTITPGAAAPD